MKRYLAVGEIVVGAGIVILSVGVLPLWAAPLGLGFLALGITGLPWANQFVGSTSATELGSRIAGVLLILGLLVWLVWPQKRVADVTLSASPLSWLEFVTIPAPHIAPSVPSRGSAAVTPSSTAERSSTLEERPIEAPGTNAVSTPVESVLAEFSAKHKHRLRDCEGILTFSANTIRFQTKHPYDSFVFAKGEVEVDDAGLKDHFGKVWHFSVEGRDVEEVFKRWKAGTLLAEQVSP